MANVYQTDTGKPVAQFEFGRGVLNVAFSPDGAYLAAAVADGTVRVLDLKAKKEILQLMSRERSPISSISFTTQFAIAFSPDGKHLAAATSDRHAHVWAIPGGDRVAQLSHDDIVTTLMFSPDGTYILTGGWDDTVRVWLWQPQDLIDEACARLTRNLTRAEYAQYVNSDPAAYDTIYAKPENRTCRDLPVGPAPTPAASPTP
jgi:WD40 repeat protein